MKSSEEPKKKPVVGKGKYPCTGCGACCRRVWAVAPEMAGPDGVCVNLLPDGLCRIYDSRPEICYATLELHNKNFPHMAFKTEKEYFESNVKACKKIILEDGLDKKYIPTLEGITYETNQIPDQPS